MAELVHSKLELERAGKKSCPGNTNQRIQHASVERTFSRENFIFIGPAYRAQVRTE